MSWKCLWGLKSELHQQGFNSSHTFFWPDKALAWKQSVFFNIVIFFQRKRAAVFMAKLKKNCIYHAFKIAFIMFLAPQKGGMGSCALTDTILLPSKEIHESTHVHCFYLHRTPHFVSKHPLKLEAVAVPPSRSDPYLYYSQNHTLLHCSALAAPRSQRGDTCPYKPAKQNKKQISSQRCRQYSVMINQGECGPHL